MSPTHLEVREWTKVHFKDFKKGQCSKCLVFGKTNTHHLEYRIPHSIKDIIELCFQCHRLEHKEMPAPVRSKLGKSWLQALDAYLVQKRAKNLMPNERQGVTV